MVIEQFEHTIHILCIDCMRFNCHITTTYNHHHTVQVAKCAHVHKNTLVNAWLVKEKTTTSASCSGQWQHAWQVMCAQ